MKIFIFLLGIFLLIQLNAKSQSILEEGKLWCNTSVGSEGGQYESYYIKFVGDFVFNNTHYKEILRSDDSEHQNWYNNGYVREDENQKVFRYNAKSDTEVLLYDFSLNVGDTIGVSPFILTVEKVYYDTFSNSKDSLKHIEFDLGAAWIEGIGSTTGTLEGIPSFFIVGANLDLVCYYENDKIIYQNSSFPSSFPDYKLSNPVIQKQNPIKISHLNNQIILSINKINTANALLQLYDLSGKKVMEKKLNGINEIQIHKNKFIQGIYIYQFKSDGLIASDKIVIR